MAFAHAPGNAGLSVQERTCDMISTSAVSRGDVIAVDRSVVDSTSLRFTTMYTPDAANFDIEMGIIGVALEDIAAGETGPFGFRGRFDCSVTGTLTVAATLGLSATTAGQALKTSALNDKIVAYLLEDAASNVVMCQFDGINGFGNDNA